MITREEKEAKRQDLRKTRLALSLKENLKRRRELAKTSLYYKSDMTSENLQTSNIKSVCTSSTNKD